MKHLRTYENFSVGVEVDIDINTNKYEYQYRDIDVGVYYKREKGEDIWSFTTEEDFNINQPLGNLNDIDDVKVKFEEASKIPSKSIKFNESVGVSIEEFLSDKPLIVKNTKYKGFLFHGTNTHPSKFELRDDYCTNDETGNDMTFECDLPEGMLFLTNDIREAKHHGKYIIPCEVQVDDMKVYEIETNNPSQIWDDDFMGYEGYGMYSTMMNEAYDMIEIRGYDKSTFVAFTNVVVPRTDLATEYYNK